GPRQRHSGRPDHGRPQPRRARRSAREEHSGIQQAGEAGGAARISGTMESSAAGGGISLQFTGLGQLPVSILDAAITAWVRLSTLSFCRIADTCAFTVASETLSSNAQI